MGYSYFIDFFGKSLVTMDLEEKSYIVDVSSYARIRNEENVEEKIQCKGREGLVGNHVSSKSWVIWKRASRCICDRRRNRLRVARVQETEREREEASILAAT